MHGRGGMKTKLAAAKTCVNSGAKTWVADGRKTDTLINLYEGKEEGTVFLSNKDTLQSRKLWLSSFGSSYGNLILDNGASEAITKKGKSILPVGITKVEGKFNRGDLITCLDLDSKELARGISNFSSEELFKIKGLNSKDLYKTLGYAATIIAKINAEIAIADFDESIILESPPIEIIVSPTKPIPNANSLFLFSLSFGSS